VNQSLSLRRNAGGLEPLAQLLPCQRSLLGQGFLDRRHGALAELGCDSLLAQAAAAGAEQRWGSQQLQPGIVLAVHKVQRAAVEPGDQQRALLAQGPVEIGDAEALGARSHCEARSAGVLSLHGEQPPGDGGGIALRRSSQALAYESFGENRCGRHAEIMAKNRKPRESGYSIASRSTVKTSVSLGAIEEVPSDP